MRSTSLRATSVTLFVRFLNDIVSERGLRVRIYSPRRMKPGEFQDFI